MDDRNTSTTPLSDIGIATSDRHQRGRTITINDLTIDLFALALGQRRLVRGVLLLLGAAVLAATASPLHATSSLLASALNYAALLIAMASLVVLAIAAPILANELRWDRANTITSGLVMLFPPIGLFAVVLLSEKACAILKQADVHIGLLGIEPEALLRLRVGACRACGYDLRSLTTNTCPECGTTDDH